jgi:hypothetical protein
MLKPVFGDVTFDTSGESELRGGVEIAEGGAATADLRGFSSRKFHLPSLARSKPR